MKPVIAATDFSDTAHNAVCYAAALATDMHAELILLHAFSVPVNFSESPMPVMPVEQMQQVGEERMALYLEELHSIFPGLAIRYRIMYGDVTDCLREFASETPPWLVIMGNTGDDRLFWMGSDLIHALKHLQLPVMAVPAGAAYHPLKKICLAADMRNSSGLPVALIRDIYAHTGAEIHVLHVATAEEEEAGAMDTLREMLSGINAVFCHERHTDITAGIRSFAGRNGIDCIILVPKKYALLESLFRKSRTRELAKECSIPLIALHNQEP